MNGVFIKKFKMCSVGLLIIFTFLFSNLGFTQPDYNMKLTNGVKVNENTIEFDVVLKGIDTTFQLTSYQCSFSFNSGISNGGQLFFSYIDGSSQLSNLPSFAVGINNYDGEQKLTFASMAGSDIITETEVKVGRFRLNNSTPFANVDPNIKWSFGGNVSTILTGEFFQNITLPVNHTSDLTLDSDKNDPVILTEYKLLQNYPNPFNPDTKISFNLLQKGHVSLTIFNLLGQQVEELVNDQYNSGRYTINFVSNGLASGTYYCKLEIDNKYVEIIKMVLLR